MGTPKIAVILSTTREGRFADKPAQWLLSLAKARGGAEYEVVDLRDYPLPHFNEAMSPAYGPPKNEVAQRFAKKIAEFDGYVFVTAEYNHSFPAVLKNALDHVYGAFARKPVAFVGYGGVGAARAIEQLRLVAVEQQAAPLRHAVHLGMVEFLGIWQQGKSFADFPHLQQSADLMLGDLLWWVKLLKSARDADRAQSKAA